MRKRFYFFISALAFALALSSGVEQVSAQREDVKQILRRLEDNTDRFSKSLDSALDHSPLNGTRAEDEINGYVHDFEEATDHLKDRYSDNGAAPNLAREVLARGQSIDRFMRRNRLGGARKATGRSCAPTSTRWRAHTGFAGAGE